MLTITRLGSGIAIFAMLGIWLPQSLSAHEPTQTHRRLTIAGFELFKANSDYDFLSIDGIRPIDVELELALGAMEEDREIKEDDLGLDWEGGFHFVNHFYEPATGTNEIPSSDTTAKLRAGELYAKALESYRLGTHLGRRRAYRILGRVLHLLEDMTSPAHTHNDPHGHLDLVGTDREINDCSFDVDDFETWGFCQRPGPSTNHIFDYFRYRSETGETRDLTDSTMINSFVDCEDGFIDDLLDGEKCSDWAETVKPYWRDYERAKRISNCGGIEPPPGFTCRLWEAVTRLYDGKPQSVTVKDGINAPAAFHGADRNAGEAFVRRLAEVVYDFTTFRVYLSEDRNSPQPDSELNRMLRPFGTGDDVCSFANEDEDSGFCEDFGNWEIFGPHQQIGFSQGKCGRFEETDITEEWWVVPHQCNSPRPSISDPFPEAVDGYAYIENIGGEGPLGNKARDSFVPLRYGCDDGDSACGSAGFFRWPGPETDSNKTMFKKLYGSHRNQEDVLPCPGRTDSIDPCPTPRSGKTMLRIHGDVLYASAVAYAAGLIQAFIDEVYRPPTAVAGGPYTGDTCGAIVFDAGGSSDQIPGLIVAYDWDFTGDGVFDRTTSAPFTAHVYLKGFSGNLVLKVTDDDGLTDEDTAVVNAVSCPIVGRTDSRSERDVFGVGASGLIELLLWLLLVVYVRRRRLSKPAHRS